jgi:hypothetical protein
VQLDNGFIRKITAYVLEAQTQNVIFLRNAVTSQTDFIVQYSAASNGLEEQLFPFQRAVM